MARLFLGTGASEAIVGAAGITEFDLYPRTIVPCQRQPPISKTSIRNSGAPSSMARRAKGQFPRFLGLPARGPATPTTLPHACATLSLAWPVHRPLGLCTASA